MYLFNTDTITNIFKPEPSKRLLKKLVDVPPEQQYISAVTVYEIAYGAYKSIRRDHHLKNLKELLLPQIQVVDFDMKAAFACGALRADLERSGETIPLADLQVAAIAIAHELVLITGNVKHFERISRLHVENWL